MRKIKVFSVFVTVLMMGLLVCTKTANAKSSVIELKTNKTYRYDLNGDKKKEKIKVVNNKTVVPSVIAYSDIYVYINERKVHHRRVRYGGEAHIDLVDFNKKDKYKELVICSKSAYAYGTEGFYALRYLKNRKVNVYNYSRNGYKSLRGRPVVKEMNGKIYILADTPYVCSSFGCFFMYSPLTLKGKRLVAFNQSKYKLNSKMTYNVVHFGYTLCRDAKLYSKASLSSKNSTVKSGNSFIPLYIKVMSKNKAHTNAFVKVRTIQGNIGWIYFEDAPTYRDQVDELLIRKPGWS